MKHLILISFLFAAVLANAQTVKNSKIVLYKVDIDVDDIIVKASKDPNEKPTLSISSPFSKPKPSVYEDGMGNKAEYIVSNGGKEITASFIDTLHYITSTLLKEQHNAELLPYAELNGKIRNLYINPAYPQLPSGMLRTVRKAKLDYPLYAKIMVYMRQAGVGVGVGNAAGDEITVSSSTKGEVNVYFEVYDIDGNKVFDKRSQIIGEDPIVSSVNYTGEGEVAGGNFDGIRYYFGYLLNKAMEDLVSQMQ
ncbi:hypothetical protein DSECCO2_177930 [anaerobic digester metagenome]